MKMNSGDDIIDMAKKAINFIEDNREHIEGMKENEIDLRDGLKEVTKLEDKVVISIQTKEEVKSVGYEFTDNGIRMNINGEVETFKLPEDVETGDVTATINNDVLEVKIPKNNGSD